MKKHSVYWILPIVGTVVLGQSTVPLNRPSAAKAISAHPNYNKPITVSLPRKLGGTCTGVMKPDFSSIMNQDVYRWTISLVNAKFLRLTETGPPEWKFCTLDVETATPGSNHIQPVAKIPGTDEHFQVVVGRRSGLNVTGITEPDARFGEAEFRYTIEWTEPGKSLKLAPRAEPEGKGEFEKYDDGWRLQYVIVQDGLVL